MKPLKLPLIVILGSVALLIGNAAQAGEKSVSFSAKLLAVDANEGCAIVDVNNDGKLDLVAGRNWYAAPDFVPRPLRPIDDRNGYIHSNGDFPYDVDGDGWIDIIAQSFFQTEINWFRNPGSEGLKLGLLWEEHLLVDTKVDRNEAELMEDIDGDSVPELIVNSWNKETSLLAWQFTSEIREVAIPIGNRMVKEMREVPSAYKITIGSNKNGHGLGIGDLNGDGLKDILFQSGWYEQPKEKAFSQAWKLHEDWFLHASIPIIVRDLNGDGRNDFIYGMGHDYGLYWREQIEPAPDGTLRWNEHLIDDSFSQPHALHMADIDGDGEDELITGKRVFAHNGKDPGGKEEAVVYYYNWDRRTKQFNRKTIVRGSAGIGLQIRTGDLNGDGRLDIAVAGKSGTYIIFNEG
tara:strand:+ start:2134 stop:3351 length:1218 start_codon:yes stop_codon:yes gene_type:complete